MESSNTFRRVLAPCFKQDYCCNTLGHKRLHRNKFMVSDSMQLFIVTPWLKLHQQVAIKSGQCIYPPNPFTSTPSYASELIHLSNQWSKEFFSGQGGWIQTKVNLTYTSLVSSHRVTYCLPASMLKANYSWEGILFNYMLEEIYGEIERGANLGWL